MSEENGVSWPVAAVEPPLARSPDDGAPDDGATDDGATDDGATDDGLPSILELAGILGVSNPVPVAPDDGSESREPNSNGVNTNRDNDRDADQANVEASTVEPEPPTPEPPAEVPPSRSEGDPPPSSTQVLATPRPAGLNQSTVVLDPPVDIQLADTPETPDTPDAGRTPTASANGLPARPPLPRIMAVANQKGGVGKTTTAVNLGAALAELGYRVLVVDLDPQGNATTGVGVNARNLQSSIYDVLLADLPMEDCIEPTGVRNLFVAPATIDLAGAEIELVPAFSRELRLRRAIERMDGEFDYVLIDCPPSLGLLTVNGLAAATEVVVPIQCEYYALEGLGQLMRNVQLVQRNLNPRLELSTIILTMYDARTKLAEQVAREVRKHFGSKVCRNIVPRTVRLSEAPSFGQPIVVFDSTSRGALAYRELAKEVSGGAPQRTR